MNPETIDNITRWLTLITLMVAFAGSLAIVGVAAVQSLRTRVVRWDMLLFVLVILWSLPYGIRNYGPELTDASIDLLVALTEKRPRMEEAIKSFIGEAAQPTPMEQPTVVFTNTPMPPQETPTPNNFQVTATVFFATALPVVPTATPRPMIQPTRTLIPSPTVCIAWKADDIARGCVPPTPISGG